MLPWVFCNLKSYFHVNWCIFFFVFTRWNSFLIWIKKAYSWFSRKSIFSLPTWMIRSLLLGGIIHPNMHNISIYIQTQHHQTASLKFFNSIKMASEKTNKQKLLVENTQNNIVITTLNWCHKTPSIHHFIPIKTDCIYKQGQGNQICIKNSISFSQLITNTRHLTNGTTNHQNLPFYIT